MTWHPFRGAALVNDLALSVNCKMNRVEAIGIFAIEKTVCNPTITFLNSEVSAWRAILTRSLSLSLSYRKGTINEQSEVQCNVSWRCFRKGISTSVLPLPFRNYRRTRIEKNKHLILYRWSMGEQCKVRGQTSSWPVSCTSGTVRFVFEKAYGRFCHLLRCSRSRWLR